MLIGIDPLLSGDLLKMLDEMGHGDELLLVDRNYPAASSGRPVIRLGPVNVTDAATAILSVFPLDTFVERPVERMEVDDNPAIVGDSQAEVLEVARAGWPELEFGVVPRLDFYRRAQTVYGVVHTLDARPYGCFILRKGVVND
ncbi:RbsD/FucU domain-containing protein [Cryobacterium sp. SO2]|uniref:RbsD/FucU family protein n=1 Tax=Cryobacterium sp. SO2 TaxID=1897060 RepID=UPI00223D3E12|nr:RbsD/FucU domain-containing protein [Cryobacterium sp. SO2]WEO76873.1 RbsD/FucU domain-containing protein [Cryobacterium sp. SO2]